MKTKEYRNPPIIAQWLLSRMVDEIVHSYAMGDFQEQFNIMVDTKGIQYARVYYWLQVFAVFPAFVHNTFYIKKR